MVLKAILKDILYVPLVTLIYDDIGASLEAQTVKKIVCNAGNLGLIPGLGRSSGKGDGNPLQCSCLENPMGRGAWRDTVQGVAKRQT